MSFPSSPSPTCSQLSVSLICTLIQAPLGKANFIKVVSWIKNEGIYFALQSVAPTADGEAQAKPMWAENVTNTNKTSTGFMQPSNQQVYGNRKFKKKMKISIQYLRVQQIHPFFGYLCLISSLFTMLFKTEEEQTSAKTKYESYRNMSVYVYK